MKIHRDIQQNSLDWLRLRVGKVTASELSNLLTPEFKLRTGEMPKTYLYSKIAEMVQGFPLQSQGSYATEQGQILETEARDFYEFETGQTIEQVAFIEHDSGRFGASPDGICGETGLEIKCPQPTNAARWLIEGKVPADYVTQVHGSLYATGWQEWKFLSYRRKFPPLILTVQRDEEIIQKIDEALQAFYKAFDAASEKLTSYK